MIGAFPERGVAPHAGAWIEIFSQIPRAQISRVAPHAGAWIEIGYQERYAEYRYVAPHAGAWIEIRRFK